MTVDVLYLAFNRLEFTKVSFNALVANTDWSLIDRLMVYDDGSTDGTREWLYDAIADVPAESFLMTSRFGSPVEVMLAYLNNSHSDVFAKIDNDIAVPAGWLPPALDVMDGCDVDLLGLAAGWTGKADGFVPGIYGYVPSSHIGGVGLMRRSAFERFPDLWGAGRQGFTQWQHAHPEIVRGWITPDLSVVQLDLIPDEPWRSLADYYVAKRWARAWPPYSEESREWWAWLPEQAAQADAGIWAKVGRPEWDDWT